MHIAHFTNTYHPIVSGVVRSVASFRQALSELGHNAFVFTQDSPNYVDEEPFIFRYTSLNLGLPNEVPAAIPFSAFMDRLIPSLKLDVIHSHHPVLLGQFAANKAHELNLPLVFTLHTRYREYTHYFPIPQELVQDMLKEVVDRWLKEYIGQCDHVVVPSESMRSVLADQYGYYEPVTVVPTGIDLRPFETADGRAIREARGWQDDVVIISVGRLSAEKNWSTLLRMTALAIEENPGIRLAIIGEGPERKKLERQVRESGIAPRVDFLGKIPFHQIPAYLKAADLFSFASTSETQGLVTLEAMAAGLPVVAVDGIGTRDLIENETEGLLTEDDSQALAAAIHRVLSNQDLREQLRTASLRKAKSMEFIAQAKKLVGVYERVVEEHRARRLGV